MRSAPRAQVAQTSDVGSLDRERHWERARGLEATRALARLRVLIGPHVRISSDAVRAPPDLVRRVVRPPDDPASGVAGRSSTGFTWAARCGVRPSRISASRARVVLGSAWVSVLEQAFRQAQGIIASIPGYISHELQKCVEIEDQYVMLVRWRVLADHTVGFSNVAAVRGIRRDCCTTAMTRFRRSSTTSPSQRQQTNQKPQEVLGYRPQRSTL